MSGQKVKCVVCGKVSVGRVPTMGTGDLMLPRRHKGKDGKPCEGNAFEAEWVKEISPSRDDTGEQK